MRKKYYLLLLAVILVEAAKLALAFTFDGVSDFYVRHIFPFWTKTYGRLSGIFGFSVGEILLYAAVVYATITLVTYIIRLIFKVFKSEKLKGFVHVNTPIAALIITLIVIVQVNNCFIMYHTKPILEDTEYENVEISDLSKLIEMYNDSVELANNLYLTFERDSNGYIIYDGDIKAIAMYSMRKLGEEANNAYKAGDTSGLNRELSLLKGYYSRPKPLLTSNFFSQQGILGYYFPFSLEANYNKKMYIANFPSTMCHELSHLKGFIREDEANFISYLACMESEEPFFIYSATLMLLEYSINECIDKDVDSALLKPLLPGVVRDMMFLTPEATEEMEDKAIIDTEIVNAASEEFLDTNLTLNGVEEGILSYNHVVELLLKYYYGDRENG